MKNTSVIALGLGLAAVLFGAVAPQTAQAAIQERLPNCSWDAPGRNPFMGDVVAAVDRYQDIPVAVRERLKARMTERKYDDWVSIRRDSIEGRNRYDPAIRDMHFGQGSICSETTRARWTAQMQERGFVYCEQGHCILVPTVCRNVSRISRRPEAVAPAHASDAPPMALASAGGSAYPMAASFVVGKAAVLPAVVHASPESGGGSGPTYDTVNWDTPTDNTSPPAWTAPPSRGFDDVPSFSPPINWTPSPAPTVISPVPEPATVSMWLAGLGMLGAWARRQRRQAAD